MSIYEVQKLINDEDDLKDVFCSVVRERLVREDIGIGAYEYWGAKGRDINYQWLADDVPDKIKFNLSEFPSIPTFLEISVKSSSESEKYRFEYDLDLIVVDINENNGNKEIFATYEVTKVNSFGG